MPDGNSSEKDLEQVQRELKRARKDLKQAQAAYWQVLNRWVHYLLITLGLIILGGFAIASVVLNHPLDVGISVGIIALPIAIIFLIAFPLIRKSRINQAISDMEASKMDKLELTWGKPELEQYKWELARRKMQYYMHENLKEVKNIYWLTVGVMLLGFLLIVIGAFIDGDITVLSGVLTQFIGATFIFVHKSTMKQANEYVHILDRINTIGTSVMIAGKIASEDQRDQAYTTIASQVLSLNVLEKKDEKEKNNHLMEKLPTGNIIQSS